MVAGMAGRGNAVCSVHAKSLPLPAATTLSCPCSDIINLPRILEIVCYNRWSTHDVNFTGVRRHEQREQCGQQPSPFHCRLIRTSISLLSDSPNEAYHPPGQTDPL